MHILEKYFRPGKLLRMKPENGDSFAYRPIQILPHKGQA